MKTFDEAAAWDIVEAVQADLEALPQELKQDILSVAIGGDLVRGDFIPNNSNLLVFPVIANRTDLSIYDTAAYQAVREVVNRHCEPYLDCAECPGVWENLAFPEIELPTTAERFDPPTVPQPQWHSLFLFDLIDHHRVVFGRALFAALYRPDPKHFTLPSAARCLQLVRSGKTSHPAGFRTISHWQALKAIRLLQLHFAPGKPTIHRRQVLANYEQHVPDFGLKGFGKKLWEADLAARYPADRREFTAAHAGKCGGFIEEAAAVLLQNRSTAYAKD